MDALNSNNKRGFTLIEALIGLVVFSWILSLYIPGYIHQLQHFQQKQEETLKWQNFYQLIQLALEFENKEEGWTAVEDTINILNSIQEYQINSFSYQDYQCFISFSDGSELVVEIEAVFH